MSSSSRLPLLLAGLFLFCFTFFSANKETGSDPKLSFLVGQAILDHGTVRLDAYQDDILIDFPFADYVTQYDQIIERDGRYYAYFPVGPSVLSLPFVGVYRLLGKDMRTYDNFELQIGLAALSVTAVFSLLYLTGTHLVSRRAALLISFFAVAGSSLSSTLGTALWSLNFSTFFIALILWLLVRDLDGRPFNPILLGLLLFLTYFSRPSTAVFIAPVLAYLLWQRRPQFWLVALSALLPLLAFFAWSRFTYGSWLPDYYSLSRFQIERPPMWVGILGNLLSPSRGLLWFSPFFWLLPIGILVFRRELTRQPLFWLCLAWFTLQLGIVSRAVIWWGGFSFGPRLLSDALPGLVLLLFLIWREAALRYSLPEQRRLAGLFLFLGLVSMAIHAAGLYRGATARWNLAAFPMRTALSGPLGDFFDPRYTQFLADNEMVCALTNAKTGAYLALDEPLLPYTLGQPIPWDADTRVNQRVGAALLDPPSPAALPAAAPALPRPFSAYLPLLYSNGNQAAFLGWQDPAAARGTRWNDCARAAIVLELPDRPLPPGPLGLTLRGEPLFGPQPLRLAVNGTAAGETLWTEQDQEITFPIPTALLRPGALNTFSFEFPEARPFPPRLEYYRLRLDDTAHAISLQELRLGSPPEP